MGGKKFERDCWCQVQKLYRMLTFWALLIFFRCETWFLFWNYQFHRIWRFPDSLRNFAWLLWFCHWCENWRLTYRWWIRIWGWHALQITFWGSFWFCFWVRTGVVWFKRCVWGGSYLCQVSWGRRWPCFLGARGLWKSFWGWFCSFLDSSSWGGSFLELGGYLGGTLSRCWTLSGLLFACTGTDTFRSCFCFYAVFSIFATVFQSWAFSFDRF